MKEIEVKGYDQKFKICALIVAAVIVLVSPFLYQHYDPNLIAYAGSELMHGINPYAQGWWYGYAYPPLYLYYAALISIPFPIQMGQPIEYDVPAANMILIKLPSIIAHIAIAAILFYSSKPLFSKKLAYAYLLAPMPLFTSAIYGNIDELMALAVFGSAILMYRGKWALSGLIWGIGASVKVFPYVAVLILPLIILGAQKKISLKGVAKFLSISIGVFLVSSLPFLLTDYQNYIGAMVLRIQYCGTVNGNQNIFGVSINSLFAGLSSILGGYPWLAFAVPAIIFANLYLYSIYIVSKSKINMRDSFPLILLFTLVSYFAVIDVNAINYIWVMPLLLIYLNSTGRHWLKLFGLLNVVLLLGIFADMTPLDFIPAFTNNIPLFYNLIVFGYNFSAFRFASLITIGIFISIWFILYQIIDIWKEMRRNGKQF